ncbi:MAG: hypothetical protein JSR58_00600 [Verrucomicrobia bacterium]|nr:hypothetical protein [Verrucomicrobiota bacterium]
MDKKKSIVSIAAIMAISVVSADQMAGSKNNPAANSINRGHEVSADQMGAGYNQSAMYDVTGTWDWFLEGSFIYWQTSQEGMDLGVTRVLPVGSPGRKVRYQDFDYKPGFKVALGFDTTFDDWVFFGEYTWLHHNNRHTKHYTGNTTLNARPWVDPTNETHLTRLTSNWDFDLDIFDLALSRPFYQGTRLTVNPVFGLRAMWLDQSLTMHVTPTGKPASVRNKVRYTSDSWALGPRGGLLSNWHLGAGFRIIGNAYAGLLYTRYTKVKDKQGTQGGATAVSVSNGTRNWLRPQLEFDLGLGWGRYIYGDKYHIDFSATYDYLVFFNQNMMRWMSDRVSIGSDGGPSNLYLQGLTLTGRFDF